VGSYVFIQQEAPLGSYVFELSTVSWDSQGELSTLVFQINCTHVLCLAASVF
jgi:hypothetical protein